MVWLNSVYIGCTLFSVSITVLDFLGFLSGSQDGGEDIADVPDAGDVQGSEVDYANVNFDSEFAPDETHTGQTAPADITHPNGRVAVLSVLSYLRSLVFFCLGFGPTGWAAIAMGNSAGKSLIWAVPAGMAAFVLARAFFRFQRTDTDSSLQSEELFFQHATVIVPLTHDTMGKVRVRVGMNVTEQYALAAEPNTQFEKGDTVWVTNVTPECVYVEHEKIAKE